MSTTNGSGDGSFSLTIRPDPRHVAAARMFCASVARRFGCDDERIQDIKVAVSEACTNSIKAHADAGVDTPIEIRIDPRSDRLIYEITDVGRGFDVSALDLTDRRELPPPDPRQLIEGGVGLTLVYALFPETEISSQPDSGGTTLRFSAPLD